MERKRIDRDIGEPPADVGPVGTAVGCLEDVAGIEPGICNVCRTRIGGRRHDFGDGTVWQSGTNRALGPRQSAVG